MVRILLPPTGGTHPLYPEYPEPLPGNPATITATVGSVTLGFLSSITLRIIKRQPFASNFLRHTGRWTTAVLCVQGFTQWGYYRYQDKPFLDEMGIKPRQWSFLQMSKMRTMDDFAVAGMATGCLFSLTRGVFQYGPFGPPSRILGAMSVGACFGLSIFPMLHSRSFSSAVDLLEQNYEKSRQARIQLADGQRLSPIFGAAGIPIIQIQHMAPSSSQSPAGDPPPGIVPPEFQPPLASLHPTLPPPGSEPHAVALVNGEIRPWPNTDYFWDPGSREDGIKKLQEHIKLLQETRKELAIEAEYLWIVIAKKEHQYYNEDNSNKKILLRKELELLGDIHSKMFQDISGYDWMISDSKKNILQLKNKKWIPEPRSSEVQKHSPERSLKLIRNHLHNVKEFVKASDQSLLPDDTPEDVRDQIEKQQEFLKQNLSATASLVREFEDYVQEGRDQAREEYLRSKADEEKKN